MKIGIDFDNTIVSYGSLFFKLARERRLIPADVPASKTAIRDFLRAADREDEWTELQGIVYGERIEEALPFPGVIEFLQECRRRDIATAIVSHRTARPYRGPDVDLHAAARRWIQRHLHDDGTPLIAPDRVFCELTREAKLARIAELGCTHFIDDLPEFLAMASFPTGVERILFDPENRHPSRAEYVSSQSWSEITARLLGAKH